MRTGVWWVALAALVVNLGLYLVQPNGWSLVAAVVSAGVIIEWGAW